MRKLKTLLILMFAASLSLTLFACGGGKKDKKEEAKTLNTLNGGTIVLDDTADETAWNARLETFELTGRNDDGTVKIKGSECDVVKDIDFGTPDRYIATFKPKENNANGLTAEVVVVINHAWGAADANGVQVCQHDGARLTPKDEDVVMHYGNFHYGTGANPALGNPPGMAAALPEIYLTAEEATALGSGFNKENGNGQVFNADAGITGKDSSGRIQPFGLDGRANKEVPTITAGDLTPGMSITIEGYARTDAGNNKDNPTGPWQVKNENWNCPSYGIADPYSLLSSTSNKGGINVGTAVIVRSEGWVLYNGIGQEAANLLGGLPAFIEGGGAYGVASGSTEASNCASWERATDKILEGQDVTNRPAYTSSDWKNWWVYSEGTDRHSLDSYGGQALPGEEGHTYVPVRVTWTYRTYGENDEIGIIVIESEYLESETVLRSYIKVPDPTRGSYRTIIHGDYSSLIITKSEYVEAETITDMRISETPQAGAKTQYLAGEQINAASVLKMEIKSEQNSAWHDGGIAVTNDMLYYYKGTGDYAAATEAIDTAADWEAVGDQPLTTAMKYFKVVLARGDSTRQAMVKENLFTIVENNVAGAVGDKYSDDLNSRDPLATYTRTIGGSGDEAYVGLAINKAVFRAVDTAKFASGITSSYSYATLRILGIADTFENITEEKNSGTVGSDTFYYNLTKSGNDVLVAIAITKDMLGKEIVIDDLQDTPIHITFGTDSVGFDVTSKATYTPFALNEGGEVEITYTGIGSEGFQIFANYYGAKMAANEIGRVWSSSITGASEGSPVNIGTDGIQVIGYETSGGDITITYKFPAFNFEKWTSMPFIRLTTSETGKAAEDYIEYDFGFEATAGSDTAANHATDDVYFYEQNGTLYFVTLVEATAGADIDPETAVAEKIGCTVNINNGNRDTARACNLTYIYEKGNIVFTSASYNTGAAYGIKNFVLNKAYGDYGLVVITSVNPAELGFTGDYGFQVQGASNYWKYNATDKSISYAEITEDATPTIVKEGNCYEKGIVAKEEKSGNTVTFLADYEEIGGQHVDEDEDNVCDLCGGTYGENTALEDSGWFPNGYLNETMNEGDIIEITGVYESGNSYANSISSFIEERGAQGRDEDGTYCTTLDGYYYWQPFSNWVGEATVPYANVEGFTEGSHAMGSSLITEEHPSNTINGWKNAQGVTIDETNFGVAMDGGTFRYTVSYINGVITTRVRLYAKGVALTGEAFIDFETTLQTATNGSYNLLMFFKQGGTAGELVDDKLTYVKSTAYKSVIDTVEAETVDGHTASTEVTFGKNGFDADRNAKLNVSGMASKDATTSKYYLAFAVNFSEALTDMQAEVVKTDGTAITGATAKFSTTTKLLVYVPLENVGDAFIIRMLNEKGASIQNSIYADLTELAVSDATATANTENLTLAETSFTISYTGVEQTDTLVIGEDSVALNAIGTGKTIGGLTVTISETFNSGAITLSFKKPAADLTKVIPGYTVRIERADKLVASTRIAPAIKATDGDTQVGQDSAWYARANGTTLYLFGQSAGTADLKFNVNAGHTTLTENSKLLGAIDLSFSIDGTNVKFDTIGAMTKNITAVYTADAEFTVFVIDLTELGIEASTQYGFAIETDAGTHADKYYTVSSGTITEAGTLSGETVFTLQAHTAENDLITAFCAGGESSKDSAIYYGYVTVTGHTFPEEGGACTTSGGVCGVTGWTKSGVAVGKTSNSVAVTYADGAEKAYNPAGANNYNVIVKGQKIVATGHITAAAAQNDAGVAALLFEGANYANDKHFRIDDWINGTSWTPGDMNSKTYTDTTAHFNFKITRTAQSGLSYEARNAIKADGTLVLTWDWTNDAKIIIKYEVTGSNGQSFWAQFDVEAPDDGALAEKYSIGIVPVNGSFTGEIVATALATKVAAENCNPGRGVAKTDPDYSENQNPSAENPITIGQDDMSNGYPGLTPAWYGKIEKGNRYIYTGTQNSKAGANWNCLDIYVFSGIAPTGLFRLDNWIVDTGNEGAGASLAEDEGWTITKTPTDFGTSDAIYKAALIGDIVVTFDWTDESVIIIKAELTSTDKSNTFTEIYTIRAAGGSELKSYYNIGFGAESSQTKFTSFTKDQQAATLDYGDLNGTITAGDFIQFIKKGETMTLTGEHSATGTGTWEAIQVVLFTGVTPTGFTLRADRFVDGMTVDWAAADGYQFSDGTYKVKVEIAAVGTFEGAVDREPDANGVDDFDKLASILADSKIEIKFDWTSDAQLVVTVKITDADTTDYVLNTYTIASATTAELPAQFNFKLALGAGAAATFTSATVTPQRGA